MADGVAGHERLSDAEIDVLHQVGALPIDAAQARDEEAAARQASHAWDPLIGPWLTPDQALALLDDVTTLEQLEAWRTDHRVLGLVLAGPDQQVMFPAWGIDAGHVLRGLPEVLQTLLPVIDAWTATRWLRTPQAAFEGATPAEALAAGERIDLIVGLAHVQAAKGT